MIDRKYYVRCFLNVMNEIFSVSDLKDVFALIVFLTALIGGGYVIFVYYFNKYYTKKYKDDFFYLFWGYEDKEDKVSADKHLSLFIYHFINAYMMNSYSYFNKRYKFFPENIQDMDPTSFMPNATKGNLENFEKKHIKWIKFNVISQYIIIFSGVMFFFLFYISDKV